MSAALIDLHYRSNPSSILTLIPQLQYPGTDIIFQWILQYFLLNLTSHLYSFTEPQELFSMPLLLLLLLVWVGHWTLRAKPPIATECQDDNKYKAEVLEMVMVQEGLCVLMPYTFTNLSTYSVQVHTGADTSQDSPVAINKPEWQMLKETQGRFHLIGDRQSNSCSLDIRDAQCFLLLHRKERKLTRELLWEASVCIPHIQPHILPLETMEPGCPRNLTFSMPWACEQGTPPIFSWMSAALTSLGPRTILSSMLTLTPRPQDHGTYLTCEVTFPGAVERTIQLNV
ncbi:hypothetical protein A6R68_19922, partial [Neotoma lepida]